MRKKRIAFFGSQGWELTNIHLERFLEKEANIVIFVLSPAGKVKTTVQEDFKRENIEDAANRLKIPILFSDNIESVEFLERFSKFKPEVIIACGFQVRIPPLVIDATSIGAINFHSSLLPRHSGMHPGFWTIWYGDSFSGMTVHFIDEGLDTGDIIYTTKVDVKIGDTIDTLYDRIWHSSLPLVERLLIDLDKGEIHGTRQDRSKYMYNYDISEDDFALDFRQPAEILAGRVMMLPGKFYFILKNKKYFVEDCNIIDEPLNTRNFKINEPYNIDGKVFFVTPRQYFEIKNISRDGKNIDPAEIIKEGGSK